MIVLLLLAIATMGIVFGVYFSYFVLVLRTKKKKQYLSAMAKIIESSVDDGKLPHVSVLIPSYNEEDTISAKIENISELDYPRDKLTVCVLDDNSADNTRECATKAFLDFGVKGKVLKNDVRSGVNFSYNNAFEKIESEYALATDADALIPPRSLTEAVKVLLSHPEVGGVAARMVPVSKGETAATKTANTYSKFLEGMYVAESAMYSTFPGSTSCLLLRKAAFVPISTDYGSSDGNISLSMLKKCYRLVLVPQITYFEPITQKMSEQRRQKIRRATRLIQSTLSNYKILFAKKYRAFGMIIFPLRFSMMVFCPLLTFLSFILFFFFLCLTSTTLFLLLLLSAVAIIAFGARANGRIFNFIPSFLVHQIYLLMGLMVSHRKRSVWQRIERMPEVA